jgi:hypothetical protein
MTRTNLRITFEIPDYWTPQQALAVYELLHGLCERSLRTIRRRSLTRLSRK